MLDFDTNTEPVKNEKASGWIRQISSDDRNSRARRFLESHLRRIRVGEALPSIRSIRQECGIGLGQVQRLLEELEGRGLVERRDRSGVYKAVSARDSQMVTTIDFIACARIDATRVSPFLNELIHCLTDLAENRYGRSLRLRQVWANQDVRSYEKLASDAQMRAVILAGSPLMGISDIFARHNIAVIELLPIYPVVEQVNVPAVVGPSNVVSRQLEYLFSLGHERIAYLCNLDPRAPAWQMLCRREEFYRTMAEHGKSVDPSLVFYPGVNDTQVCESVEEHFSGRELPTAVITYDRHINGFYKWANGKGLEIGKDISVVSTNDMPQASLVSPAVSSLRISRDRIADLTLDALEKAIRGKEKPALIETPGELIVRDSTGQAPK